MEGEDTNSDSDNESLLCITTDAKDMIVKLDSLLQLVFEYIQNTHKKCLRSGDEKHFAELFESILHIFNKIMLPTHKLRSVQFVLFYVCSLSPQNFPEDFMGLLVSHLMTVSNSSVTRMLSSSYLGSFIARAKFIETNSVRQCLALLNHQCQSYIDNHESSIKGKLEVSLSFCSYLGGAIWCSICFRSSDFIHFLFSMETTNVIGRETFDWSVPSRVKWISTSIVIKVCPT